MAAHGRALPRPAESGRHSGGRGNCGGRRAGWAAALCWGKSSWMRLQLHPLIDGDAYRLKGPPFAPSKAGHCPSAAFRARRMSNSHSSGACRFDAGGVGTTGEGCGQRAAITPVRRRVASRQPISLGETSATLLARCEPCASRLELHSRVGLPVGVQVIRVVARQWRRQGRQGRHSAPPYVVLFRRRTN